MGRETEIEAEKYIFEQKMEKPQKDFESKDWKSFKSFFEKDPKALLQPFDLAGNTAIHITADKNKPQLLREFLQMLSPRDQWHSLRRKNVHKSTLLHSSDVSVQIASIVLNYEKKLPLPPDNEIDAEHQEEKELPMLEIRNIMGETPIYRAAIDGKMLLLKYLVNKVTDLKKHFGRERDKSSILHAAVAAQHFDVALYLLKVDNTLADEKDDNGCTCLQLLSNMPSVFYSGIRLGTAHRFLYSYLLPDYRYYDDDDDDDDSTKVILPTRNIETGENKIKQQNSVLSRINLAIWDSLAEEWDGIKGILKTKKKNMLTKKLADILVSKDGSWQKSFVEKQKPLKILPPNLSSHASTLLNQSEPKGEEQCTEETSPSLCVHTPLLLATATGIVEIVEEILIRHPQAINHVSEDELNILHVAVMYRQREIFKIVKDTGAWKWLRNRLSGNGDSILHQVGSMAPYGRRHESGVAYQLQDELLWFERVKKILPPFLNIHCNDDNVTAWDLFETEHRQMLTEAKEWIKKTSESCSAVAVLVATVVFAAAFTVPGGTNPVSGIPLFLSSSVFLFFTIMDVVALASSLAAVVMFLSVLTSPFEIEDFLKSLPRKLSLGFGFLFFSLTTTMLAFSATILLTIKLEKNKWTSTLVYSAAFFPVAVFGLFQFPFYEAVKDLFKGTWKYIKKVLPRSFKRSKSSKWIKKRKYRKVQ